MASHNYWLKRASLQDSLMRATEDETIKRINDQLAILEDDLVKEIHTFYSRYAQDNRMTQADAMKYLTDDELKEFQNVNLARFREMALDPKTDPALLDALSYRHRISRKQAMIHEIQRRTGEVYSSSGAISATVGKGLASGYIKTAAQVGKDMAEAGILSIKPAIKLNDDLILRRMSSKWSGKEFSSRVWTQGQEHFNSIRETLDKALTGGWSLDKTVLELRKRTGVARHNAERLVRTEMTAYNTMANYDMYKALGAKTYKIEAILDSKTSAVCRHQNNKVYLMDDFAPGTTAPPFHVHCRSKIIPTTHEEESEFLESHGYGSPDDSSSDVDQDGQSTSGRKPTLDEVLQIYVDQARELSEKYGLQTVEQVQAIRNAPQVTHKRVIRLKGEDVKKIKAFNSNSDLDFMAQHRAFDVKDDKGNSRFRLSAVKQMGTDYSIWMHDSTKKSRDTLDLILRNIKNIAPNDLPDIVVASSKLMKDAWAGYDHVNDILYFSNELQNEENVIELLKKKVGFFASETFDDMKIHELAHRKHWKSAERLYKSAPSRYTSIEKAKEALDSNLKSYVKAQVLTDWNYTKRISNNAHVHFLGGNINELVAEIAVLGERIGDKELLKRVEEVLEWKQ